MFLGDDLLPYLVLAFGAAMVVGTALALFRPPPDPDEDGDEDAPVRQRPPLGRSLVMMAVGGVAAIWALASLVTG